MKPFLALLFLAVGVPAILAAGKSHALKDGGKEVAVKSGQLIDWYSCAAQGNYPDPTTCDHYIACTTALLAYQMPCQMGHSGRLWYVRDSGPVEAESYCDYPELVDCKLSPATTEPPAPTDPTTTEQTTTKAPETTNAPPTGGSPSCEAVGVVVDADCDPAVDCHQCGYCDSYLYCPEKGNKWTVGNCDEIPEPDGTVLVAKKLFWNSGSTEHGGTCDFYDNLSQDQQTKYRQDGNCKPICAFWVDPSCDRKYWYTDPNLANGIWKDKADMFWCPAGTRFDEGHDTCSFCDEGQACNVGC